MRLVFLTALAVGLVSSACNEAPRTYRECPPGVDPSSYDCVRTGSDGGADDVDGGAREDGSSTIDTTAGPFDTGFEQDTTVEPDGCLPICDFAECGSDGCGGSCGACGRGERCNAGVCQPRGGSGTGSCRDIIDCVGRCDTDMCWRQCFMEGTPEAQELFTAAVDCIEINCSEFIDDDAAFARCQDEICGDLLMACYDTGTTETLSCGGIVDCVVGCDTDACQQDCYFAGDRNARRAFEDLVACAEPTDRCDGAGSVEEWLACVREICPGEYASCFETAPPDPMGGCNQRDLDALASAEDAAAVLVECGWSCISESGEVREDCVTACVARSLDLSAGCAVCTGELSACVVLECGDLCDDPQSDRCSQCVSAQCEERFLDCANLPG